MASLIMHQGMKGPQKLPFALAVLQARGSSLPRLGLKKRVLASASLACIILRVSACPGSDARL